MTSNEFLSGLDPQLHSIILTERNNNMFGKKNSKNPIESSVSKSLVSQFMEVDKIKNELRKQYESQISQLKLNIAKFKTDIHLSRHPSMRCKDCKFYSGSDFFNESGIYQEKKEEPGICERLNKFGNNIYVENSSTVHVARTAFCSEWEAELPEPKCVPNL